MDRSRGPRRGWGAAVGSLAAPWRPLRLVDAAGPDEEPARTSDGQGRPGTSTGEEHRPPEGHDPGWAPPSPSQRVAASEALPHGDLAADAPNAPEVGPSQPGAAEGGGFHVEPERADAWHGPDQVPGGDRQDEEAHGSGNEGQGVHPGGDPHADDAQRSLGHDESRRRDQAAGHADHAHDGPGDGGQWREGDLEQGHDGDGGDRAEAHGTGSEEDASPESVERRPMPGLANLRLPTRNPQTETPATRAIVVGVANQKGGVGKTTTTVSLAAALAQAGVRTLVVDLDPQGNATTGLGQRAEEGDPSSYGVLVEEMRVTDAVQSTEVDGLDVLPSSLDLAGAEVELVPAFSRELRLRRALEPVIDRYDVILIDCPPSLGLLTINALVAADQVLVPIQCEYYALEGLGQLMRTVQLVGDNLNRGLELGGVLLTMFDGRTKLAQQVVDEVRNYFGDQAYETIIPRTVRLSEAPSFGQPITVFDPSSRGARAYERLAHEVITRLGLPSTATPEALDGRSALDRLLGGPAPTPDASTEEPVGTAAPSAAPDEPEGQP
jgi:chromosome partitioning protein